MKRTTIPLPVMPTVPTDALRELVECAGLNILNDDDPIERLLREMFCLATMLPESQARLVSELFTLWAIRNFHVGQLHALDLALKREFARG